MSAAGGLTGRGRLSLIAPQMPKLMGLPSAPGLATEGIAQQLEATQAAGQRTQNLLQARQKEQSRVTQIKKPGSMPQTRSASLLGG